MASPNLPAALLRHTAADPEEPWLFRAEGWDWVWYPWGELARRMSGWAERLSHLPSEARVVFSYRPHPESVVLDLAIQAAGLVSVPGERREGDVWVEIEGGEIKTSSPGPLSHPPSIGRERGDGGGAVVRIGDDEVQWTATELVAAGERLHGEIGEPGREREIVVLGGDLQDPVERTMLSWATLAGGAVVLEPDPALRVATAAWVRPTVFHGTPAEITELRTRVGRGKRLPFRRLRTMLVSGALSAEEAGFWRGRGVKVRPLAAR